MSLLSGFLQKVTKVKDFSSPSDPLGTLYKHIEKKSINQSNLNKDLGLQLDNDTASIETVTPNSIAANHGISSGYYIYHVNGQFVETADDVQKIMSLPTMGVDLKILPREGIDQLLRIYNDLPDLDVDFAPYLAKEPKLYAFLSGVHPLHSRWRKRLEAFRRLKQTAIEVRREREERALAELDRAMLGGGPTPAQQPPVLPAPPTVAKPFNPNQYLIGGAAGVPLNQSVVAADLFNTDHAPVFGNNNGMFQQAGSDDALVSMLLAHGSGSAKISGSSNTELGNGVLSSEPTQQDGATDAQLLMLLQQQQLKSNSAIGMNSAPSAAAMFAGPTADDVSMQPKFSNAVVMAVSPTSATDNKFPTQLSPPQAILTLVPEALYTLKDGTTARVILFNRHGPLPPPADGEPAEIIKAFNEERRRQKVEKRKADKKAVEKASVPTAIGGNPNAPNTCFDFDKGYCSRGANCKYRHDPPRNGAASSSNHVDNGKRDRSPPRRGDWKDSNGRVNSRDRDKDHSANRRDDYRRDDRKRDRSPDDRRDRDRGRGRSYSNERDDNRRRDDRNDDRRDDRKDDRRDDRKDDRRDDRKDDRRDNRDDRGYNKYSNGKKESGAYTTNAPPKYAPEPARRRL